MAFYSILFERPEDSIEGAAVDAPAFFSDLHLDKIIGAITTGKEQYGLTPFFSFPLHSLNAITYRQEIMRDLENPALLSSITAFANSMGAMREHLARAEKAHFKYQKERWLLDAVDLYCNAVNDLACGLTGADINARGLVAFREYLCQYAQSFWFTSLLAETTKLEADLSAIRYCLLLKDGGFTVRRYEFEGDYSLAVLSTFEKFKQGPVKDYRMTFSTGWDMNHIEDKVLEFVAQLFPDVFGKLDDYCLTYASSYLDERIRTFDSEIQFYIAYLEYISTCKSAGLKFCYPQLSDTSKTVYDYEGFDLALAHTLISDCLPVVCNDFSLNEQERIIVVSGPNQGGKTTFARAFGQIHYLAALGCPVPGRDAHLFVFDKLFTHFEKEEDVRTLRSNLEDDLIRVHDILNHATTNSIVIMNEIFAATTLKDAIVLSKKIMEKLIELDPLCV